MGKNWNISYKTRNISMVSSISIFIQCSVWFLSHTSKSRKRNKRDTTRKERSQTILMEDKIKDSKDIVRWHLYLTYILYLTWPFQQWTWYEINIQAHWKRRLESNLIHNYVPMCINRKWDLLKLFQKWGEWG
jgi:hypothetical protein